MNEIWNLSRRGALGSLGGLILGFSLPGCRAILPPLDGTVQLGPPLQKGPPVDISAWVRIAPDNTVTLRMGAAEMGQGVFTSLPLILAEELDLSWEQVRAESAPADGAYRRLNVDFPGKVQLTGGSLNVRGYWDILQLAGATARAMLVAAAAEKWSVRPEDCTVKAGVVRCGDQQATYGELAPAAAHLSPGKVSPKDPKAWTLLGTSVPRLDLPAKVDGSALFAIDVVLPGMLSASVRHCPHFGGRLQKLDDKAARAVPGVKDVLPIGDDIVVVVANTFWTAEKAARLLNITWDKGPNGALDDEAIGKTLKAALDGGGRTVHKAGHVNKDAPWDVESTFEVPYLEHAVMEPMSAVAWVEPDRAQIWAGTQIQLMSRRSAAKILGLQQEQVEIHTTFLGGGLGRRSERDFTDLAVEVARHFEVPVKVIWTREECFTHGFYRPRMLCRQRARLGKDGLPTDWTVEMAGQNIMIRFVPGMIANSDLGLGEVVAGGFGEMPYTVPNSRVTVAPVELPIPVGWWRSVQGSHNGFFREAFVDEMAAKAGVDPIEYRRRLLAGSPRHLRLFEAALTAAGPLVAGRHRGVALFESFGSHAAEVADITVEGDTVRVHRVGAAIDCGTAIHPDTTKAQVMGALTMGLSEALYGKLSIREGAVVEQNFHNYRMLAMAEAPEVEVVIVNSGEALGGVGEPGLPPIAGALANAVAAATGKRVYQLPIAGTLG